jgi:hypothetical protein
VCLTECDIGTSKRRRPRPDLGCCATGKEGRKYIHLLEYTPRRHILGVEMSLPSLLVLVLGGGEVSVSRLSRYGTLEVRGQFHASTAKEPWR